MHVGGGLAVGQVYTNGMIVQGAPRRKRVRILVMDGVVFLTHIKGKTPTYAEQESGLGLGGAPVRFQRLT